MSAYSEAIRQLLEPTLVCPCGEMNRPEPHLRRIRIQDSRGYTSCDTCGRTGTVREFQLPESPQV